MKRYKGAPITLDFLRVDVTNLLKLISEVANVNMVLSPEVRGVVNVMKITDTPWDQVLDLILLDNELAKRQVGNTMWITTKAHMAKIEVEEKRKSELRSRTPKSTVDQLVTDISKLFASKTYVDKERLKDLKGIRNPNFDLTKLVRMCEDLNLCYATGAFLAIPMLTRAILDHVPPLFAKKDFNEVSNHYGGSSFKKSMRNLDTSLRSIADAFLHLPIRTREALPTETQINFKNDLDVLLQEVVRVTK